MKRLSYLFIALAISLTPVTVNAGEQGILSGGQVYDLPDWFAQGFLEFDHEVSEGKKAGKQVMVFSSR